jgi:hypothetical protein
MLFSQTIDNIDSEITALLAQVEAAKQRQTQFLVLGNYHYQYRSYAPNHPVSAQLTTLFDATIGTSFDTSVTPDVLQQLLADKRSANTRRAYEKDVTQFFRFMTGKEVTPDLVLEFLHLERTQLYLWC